MRKGYIADINQSYIFKAYYNCVSKIGSTEKLFDFKMGESYLSQACLQIKHTEV
jgi:hypothetical protein